MATAAEKQAKADARAAAAQSVVAGKNRLPEVNAAGAFAGRRLRAAGDLSRYGIGGFLDDPNKAKPVTPTPTAPPKPLKRPVKPIGSGTPMRPPAPKAAAPLPHPPIPGARGGARPRPPVVAGGGPKSAPSKGTGFQAYTGAPEIRTGGTSNQVGAKGSAGRPAPKGTGTSKGAPGPTGPKSVASRPNTSKPSSAAKTAKGPTGPKSKASKKGTGTKSYKPAKKFGGGGPKSVASKKGGSIKAKASAKAKAAATHKKLTGHAVGRGALE